MSIVCALFGVLSGSLLSTSAGAQELVGEVRRQGLPLPGADVLLHQVSADSAGEVARRSTGPLGRFRFAEPALTDIDSTDEIFFASVRHDGVLYFGSTLGSRDDLEDLYVIEVFDTATAPAGAAPVALPVRNVILEPIEGGWQATDLIELRNDVGRTWVGSAEGAPVWRHPLPESAVEASVGQSDLPVGAGFFERGMAITNAAIMPGSRVYMFRYRIPELQFALPVVEGTERLEVLVQEPAPALSVVGLAQAPPAELEPGSTFRRYVGTNLAAANVVFSPGNEAGELPLGWLIVVMALALSAVGLWAVMGRRATLSSAPSPSQPNPGPVPLVVSRQELLLKIAQLDQDFAEREGSGPEAEQRYARERAALLNRLREAGGAR